MNAPSTIYLSLVMVVGAVATGAETNAPSFPMSPQDEVITITNTSGQVFINATIKEVRPDGLKVFHSTGIAMIPFRELPHDLQQKYNYDPQAEKKFQQKMAADQKQARLYRAKNDLIEAIRKTELKARLRVIQVGKEGMLATGCYYTEEEYEDTEYRTVTKTVGLGGSKIDNTVTRQIPVKTEKRTRAVPHDLPDRIFLVASFSNLVDDDWFKATIYPCGRHQYTTVMGISATVERYATTPEKALELLASDQ